ncbi:MAG TPA: TQO small subunit DoxD [Terriglobales bacterium]|nr:TQO small subunit DoxD [Terriglobales bacterium]
MLSTFPDGWPGAGLMLLRAAGGTVLITQAATYFSNRHEPGFLPAVVVSAVIVVGVLLLIGLLTRAVAVLAALVGISTIFAWFPGSGVDSLDARMTAALSAVIALSIVCLGPGALSLDARLFGRREIIIPSTSSRT